VLAQRPFIITDFYVFPEWLQAHANIVSHIRPQILSYSTLFPNYY
jgi:hypothetical protein